MITRSAPRCTCCGAIQGYPHAGGCRFAYTIWRAA